MVVKKVIKPSPYQRQNLIFDFTAEQPDALIKTGAKLYSYWNGFDRAPNAIAYAFRRSNAFSRSGEWSMRVELRKTDDIVAGSKRAEAARASTDEPLLKERWYGMSYYLTNEYVPDVSAELVTQWQSLKFVSPPLALWTENGRWKVVQNGDIKTDIGPYQKEKWTDFVFHVRWSLNSTGLIEVWKDGVKVFTKAGVNSYTGYVTGNYMKVGIYKWGWARGYPSNTTVRIIYADEIRIGNENATYKDVSP